MKIARTGYLSLCGVLFAGALLTLEVTAASRHALVIGNARYEAPFTRLTHPEKDADALCTELKGFGFTQADCIKGKDADAMSARVQALTTRIEDGDTVLFYFSGHGFQDADRQGEPTNFLLGQYDAGTPLQTSTALRQASLSLSYVRDELKRANPNGTNLLIIDACRQPGNEVVENMRVQGKSLGQFGGFVPMQGGRGFLVAYATQPNRVAQGFTGMNNSLFTGELLGLMRDQRFADRNVLELLNAVGQRVENRSRQLLDQLEECNTDAQVPSFTTSPISFCFAPPCRQESPQVEALGAQMGGLENTVDRLNREIAQLRKEPLGGVNEFDSVWLIPAAFLIIGLILYGFGLKRKATAIVDAEKGPIDGIGSNNWENDQSLDYDASYLWVRLLVDRIVIRFMRYREELTIAVAWLLGCGVLYQWGLLSLENIVALVSGIGGAGLVAHAMLISGYFDKKVSTGADVEKTLNVPMLSSLPQLKLERRRGKTPLDYMHVNSESCFSESIRRLCIETLQFRPEIPNKIVVVTSAVAGEGKSTVAMSLAHALSDTARIQVLLIDADLRKPSLSPYMGFANDVVGLSELLSNSKKLGECVHCMEGSRVYFMPSGAIVPNPWTLLSSKSFARTLESLSNIFSHIIIDSSPVMNVGDAKVVSAYATGVVYVVKAKTTPQSLAKEGIQRLHDSKIDVIGGVLNGVTESDRDFESYPVCRFSPLFYYIRKVIMTALIMSVIWYGMYIYFKYDHVSFLITALGVGCWLGVVFLILKLKHHWFDGRVLVQSRDDVENKLGISLIGEVPQISKGETALDRMRNNPISVFSEAFWTLGSRVMRSGGDSPKEVILVTSTTAGEGKSTVAINLAKSLSEMGGKVVLIDANLRRPVVGKRWGLAKNALGLSEFISQYAKLGDCVHCIDENRVHVMPSGAIWPNPTQLLLSKRFADSLKHLSDTFGYIIIDSPPIASASDARVLSTYATGVIYVVKAMATPYPLARAGIKRLRNSGAHIIGGVVNQQRCLDSTCEAYSNRSDQYLCGFDSRFDDA